MEGRIELRGLRFMAVHGVHDRERRSAQPFEMDIDVVLDVEGAARSDDLSQTVDYSAIADLAAEVMGGPPRRLLESLADNVAAGIMEDPRALSATVSLRKLEPPVAHELGSAGVRITRER